MTTPTYDPKDTRYWDRDDLEAELRRQYDVCHGCRLCWNLCPAFPAMFDITDAAEAADRPLTREELKPVDDLCFQCKLCWVVCPYTDPHEYQLDVPALIERSKYVRAREQGIPLSKKLVADQDRLAKLAGGPLAPLTNLANATKPGRIVAEMITGVHRDAIIPKFHSQTFTSWFRKHYGAAMRPSDAPVRKVAFFASCTVDNNEPQIGKACIAVLEHNNVEVVVPEQQCCGMPLADAGDWKGAQGKMDYNLERLVKLVDEGYDIVVPQPTCTLVLRNDYPKHSAEAEAARRVAEHTFEFGHYLVNLAKDKVLQRDFKQGLGKVAFHVACHTRAQAVGANSPRLLGILPDTTVSLVESCSGHDGSWGISKQYFPLSLKVGKKLFDNLAEGAPDVMISDCPLAAHHIELGTGRRPIHTAQALVVAYGLEGAEKVGR
jgi:glycerol-3-phosphate dehydrogenase subunit C